MRLLIRGFFRGMERVLALALMLHLCANKNLPKLAGQDAARSKQRPRFLMLDSA